MFGLFDKVKANKLKKQARKRAESFWKSRKIVDADIEFMKCIFCKAPIKYLEGYLFNRDDILNNDKFMNEEISKLEKRGIPPEQAQEMVWNRIENTYEEWIVCEKCISRLV